MFFTSYYQDVAIIVQKRSPVSHCTQHSTEGNLAYRNNYILL